MRAFLVVAAVVSSSSLAQQSPFEPPPPPPPLSSTEVNCYPTCRSGYVCSLGECISRCNPPCGPGQRCLDSGECSLMQTTPQPGVQPQLQPYEPPPLPERGTTRAGLRVSSGWAVGAGIYGIITMVVTATLTGICLGLYDTALPSTIAGAIATIFYTVSNPIVAAGAGSARRGGQVSGLVGARIVGWILYGLTLATAVLMAGLGLGELQVPVPLIVSFGAGAVLSTLFMTLDAFVSASQARTLKEELGTPGVRHAPFVAVVPSSTGKGLGVVGGWSVAF